MNAVAARMDKRGGRFAPGGADLLVLSALIALAALPLLAGRTPAALIYRPDAVLAGQWWRVFTHPLAHVSIYHLVLDAGAFLLLYRQLAPLGLARRVAIAAAAAAGSLAAAHLAPGAFASGLCGLSGAAHGLMAALGLDMALRGAARERRAGWTSLAMVVGKSLIEAATGSVFFADIHLGDIGRPIAVCHLGGVFGGAVAWAVAGGRARKTPSES